jgi:hypothetical protein
MSTIYLTTYTDIWIFPSRNLNKNEYPGIVVYLWEEKSWPFQIVGGDSGGIADYGLWDYD